MAPGAQSPLIKGTRLLEGPIPPVKRVQASLVSSNLVA